MATAPKTIKTEVEVSVKLPTLKAYVAYRRAQLTFESNELATSGGSLLGGGSMIARGERLRVIELMLAEFDRLGEWLENGEPAYIPPLSENEKINWRWARDQGAVIPEHIEAQL
jgi:hypothetical protein